MYIMVTGWPYIYILLLFYVHVAFTFIALHQWLYKVTCGSCKEWGKVNVSKLGIMHMRKKVQRCEAVYEVKVEHFPMVSSYTKGSLNSKEMTSRPKLYMMQQMVGIL